MNIYRRYHPPLKLLSAVLLGLAGWAITLPAYAADFSMTNVEAKAKMLVNSAYDAKPLPIPAFLKDLSPEQYAQIQDVSPLWRGDNLPFQAQFYLPGSWFHRPVVIRSVVDGVVQPIRFTLKHFTFGDLNVPEDMPSELGYAGFRLLAPLNTPPHYNEFISFLGATYFRAVGKGAIYGTSARGLGIDTAQPSGEIFPYFKQFWLVQPKAGATQMVVYALMDSPVATGAYRFTIQQGDSSTVHVDATIYLRKPVQVLELAPLTSMYWHGHGRGITAGDWHPAQHDSSDLVMANGNGEWITRPIDNPLHIQTTTYDMDHPVGFGLIQEDRQFSAYEGIETDYQRRPSVWVQPDGDWGKGQVRLVELPTNNRDMDNIAVFWVPEHEPAPKTPLHFAYTLRFFLNNHGLIPLAHPVGTYLGDDVKVPGARTVVIDFAGGALTKLPGNMPVQFHLDAQEGAKVLSQNLEWDKKDHFWRVIAVIQPQSGTPSNVRCFLTLDNQVMSNTWTYLLHAAKE
ncbi:MAG: OpgD/OpgG family glucan biosynthesis protein [Acidithiobacillus sp.]|jgi:glucans biosynthesis protein